MEHNPDWESVLQYIADPMVDYDFSEKPVAERAERAERAALAFPPASSQVPTPPQSHDGSPSMDGDSTDTNTLVSVSTTFYPGAQIDTQTPDLVLLSSDSVFFYVHSHVLLGASENGFKSMLPASPPKDSDQVGPIRTVPESSAIFNIILHTIYDISCAHYSPSFGSLVSAVDALKFYGIPLRSRIVPSTPLFTVLLSHAPLYPLELYSLAAYYDLYDLAVSTSSHLLSFPLATLTDETARRIGPVYLKRLFFLHFGRADALKRILLLPPHPHAPTSWCDFAEQKKLTRAWALASAYLAWDARPDLSTSAMESALSPLGEHLSCELCRATLKDRIKNLVVQWSVVKRTI